MIPFGDIERRCFKEPNSGCWLWERAIGNGIDGYGRAWDKEARKTVKAHRAVWEAIHGPLPDKIHVLHKCDTPACCRPDHLFIGTDKDNLRDMSRKGRSTFGERGSKKLTNEQALAIFNDCRQYKDIALEYGVAVSCVCDIKTGHKWSRITGADYYAEGGQRRRKSTVGNRKDA